MSCQEIENKILEDQENPLPHAQRAEVETHLAGCAGCRVFAWQLQQLEAALSARIKAPALSAKFDQRLRARMHIAPAPLSEAQWAERKRQLQAEFAAGQARIVRGAFAWGSLLKYLTWPVLALLAAWLAWRLTVPLTTHLHTQSLDGLDPTLLPWLAASAVLLAIGLAETFPRPWKSFGFR